jgi:hypothetical protein
MLRAVAVGASSKAKGPSGLFYLLIESALWQVGRQDNAHVSEDEAIVTTRPCDGNKSWGDVDSVMVTNQR